MNNPKTKKILFITAHRPGRAPSQRFRFEQYLDFLNENGYQCDLSFLISERDDEVFYSEGRYIDKFQILVKSLFIRIKDVIRRNSYDIIFIHREAFMLGTSFFEEHLSRSKAKIIYDFDDAIWIKQSSEFSSNKKLAWLKSGTKISKTIALADVVFAGNKYLQNYALKYNDNTILMPTTVNTDEYWVPNYSYDKSTICIGWSGSHTTIEHFIHAIPFLNKIKEKYKDKVFFRVMGDKNYRNEVLNIQGIPWTRETEVKELSEFDIGIMPLPDQEWTKGKCGLKGLTYMSIGIPTIMSPVGVNKEIIQSGVNGFLSETEDEWVDKLSLLIENAALRKKLGEAGRKTVEEKYSVNAQKERYLYYFDALMKKK